MIFADYPGNFWAVLPAVMFAVILVFAYLGRESRKAGLWNVFFLILQYAAVAVLLVILWNPSRPQMSETSARNTVLVLFDTSLSMSVVEEEGVDISNILNNSENAANTRLDKAAGVFMERFSPSDPEGPDYRIYGFDHQSYYSDTVDTLRRWGGRTNLQSVFGTLSKYELNIAAYPAKEGADLQDTSAKGKVVGAVIFTDGQADDKNVNSYLPIRDEKMRVVIVGIGSRSPQTDIAVKSIKAPSRIAIGSVYNVNVVLDAKNLKEDESVVVELFRDEDVIGMRQLSSKDFSSERVESFSVAADRLGRQSLSVRTRLSRSEVNPANNIRSTMVEIVENPKLKVLFYSQVVNFDIGKIRQALARDKKIKLDLGLDAIKQLDLATQAATTSGHVKLPEDKAGFYNYDVIILGPCAVDRFTESQLDGLYSFVVERGGGLVFLPGKAEYGPSGWRNQKIRSLLPVYFEGEGGKQVSVYGRMLLSDEGLESRILSKEDIQKYDEAASPFYGGIDKKPAATTLASVRENPVLAAHRVGRGRVCLVNVAGLFKWYREDLEGGLLKQFVSGMTSYIGTVTKVEAGVELFAERIDGGTGIVKFDAYVRNKNFEPVSGAAVLLNFNGKTMRMNEVGRGYYSLEIESIFDESLIASAQAEREGVFLGEKTIAAGLPPVRNEMTDIEIDRDFLRSLAKRVGAEYYDADSLDKELVKKFEAKTQVTNLSRMISIWPRWSLFLGLCAMVSINWFIRRAKGLV
ncbi:MAG: hypothetical protein E4H40_00710 [Candidatus Brocadiia bacterium]|nr:MAG: hypothetical protein E4H40_00710 [Candidatus Brocadiia bacterium]